MAEAGKVEETSIISVIRRMIQSGESEENIIKSLRELGIDSKKAKRLLLIGEADTFSLLQSEINKIVKQYFEKEKPNLVKYIKEETDKVEKGMADDLERRALLAFREDQRFIENQATMFQARVNQSVKNILQLNEETKKNVGEVKARLSNTERDVWALKDRLFGSKTIRIASMVLVALEIGLIAATGYLFFMKAEGASTELLLVTAIVGIILVTMVMILRLRA